MREDLEDELFEGHKSYRVRKIFSAFYNNINCILQESLDMMNDYPITLNVSGVFFLSWL